MEIPLNIYGDTYDEITIEAWQSVWDHVCKMAYEGTDICESIITRPGVMTINGKKVFDKRERTHSQEYARLQPINTYFLTLDNMWKQYSDYYPEVKVIPEFKKLIVPYALYQSLGITQWFRYSFPNCEVIYWEA